jgi:hypothetical protein
MKKIKEKIKNLFFNGLCNTFRNLKSTITSKLFKLHTSNCYTIYISMSSSVTGISKNDKNKRNKLKTDFLMGHATPFATLKVP